MLYNFSIVTQAIENLRGNPSTSLKIANHTPSMEKLNLSVFDKNTKHNLTAKQEESLLMYLQKMKPAGKQIYFSSTWPISEYNILVLGYQFKHLSFKYC